MNSIVAHLEALASASESQLTLHQDSNSHRTEPQQPMSSSNLATNRALINAFINNQNAMQRSEHNTFGSIASNTLDASINPNDSHNPTSHKKRTTFNCSLPSKDEQLKMTADELRCLAEKHCRAGSSLTRDEMNILFKFHEEQQHALAMKAIELGISVSSIDALWGRRIAVRIATAWNRFLQTPEAKAIFQEAGGISGGIAMAELSRIWKAKSPDERALYKAPPTQDDPDFGDRTIGRDRQQALLQPRTAIKTNSTSLKKCEDLVRTFLADWHERATVIGRTCSTEFVIHAVSTHLASHSFQLSVSTPRAEQAVELMSRLDGVDEYGGRLQAYCTGNSLDEIIKKRKRGGESKATLTNAIEAMSEFVCTKTNGLIPKWPWSKTDSTLAGAGLQVVLREGSKLDINVIKSPSKKLLIGPARQILEELSKGIEGICLIPLADNIHDITPDANEQVNRN
ncbi:hypothetical protein DFH28DRAFT_1132607 [Melampsora americana]|nr:hypothetical protein DFH28DRAFT_1132607 [Melampsora americana]